MRGCRRCRGGVASWLGSGIDIPPCNVVEVLEVAVSSRRGGFGTGDEGYGGQNFWSAFGDVHESLYPRGPVQLGGYGCRGCWWVGVFSGGNSLKSLLSSSFGWGE